MVSFDIFYQGEGVTEFAHIEADGKHTVADLKLLIAEKHGLALPLSAGGAEISEDQALQAFLEDGDEPLGEALLVAEMLAEAEVRKLHFHRCRHVAVTVRYGGVTYAHEFSPSTTVAKVKKWAANKAHMSAEDASEHMLQLAGTSDRPAPGTHLGSLVACPDCRLAFDLVADQRVNGASVDSGSRE